MHRNNSLAVQELVELVLRKCSSRRPRNILDIGCGTGAIGLALLNKLNKNDNIDGEGRTKCVGIDKSMDAVELSNENAAIQGFRDDYEAINVSINDFHVRHGGGETFDIIVSNPPYIPKMDMRGLAKTVIDFEDYDALCGGDDGLDIVNDILKKFVALAGGETGARLFMEVDSSHPALLEGREGRGSANNDDEKSKSEVGEQRVVLAGVYKDFSGHERFVEYVIRE